MAAGRPCAVRCGSWSLKAWRKAGGDISCETGGEEGLKIPVSVGDVDVAGRMRIICHLPVAPSCSVFAQRSPRGHVLRGLGSTVPLTYPHPTPPLYTVLTYSYSPSLFSYNFQ